MFSAAAIPVAEKEENQMGKKSCDLWPSWMVKGLPELKIASRSYLTATDEHAFCECAYSYLKPIYTIQFYQFK